MKTISSLQNSRIKDVVHLRSSRARKNHQLTIVEGCTEITRALEAKVVFREVYVCVSYLRKYDPSESLVKKFSLLKTELFAVSPEVYQKISFGDRKEGVVAVCESKSLSLERFPPSSKGAYVVLEGIEKPGNLGAIFRTCDGAGVDGIILCDGCSDVYNPNVIRASIATVFSVPFARATNEEAYAFLQSRKIRAYAATPEAKTIYCHQDLHGASAIVLGNEHSGLSAFWLQKADGKVRIPMKGIADSLNVSTSGAILIYEMLRQKTEK